MEVAGRLGLDLRSMLRTRVTRARREPSARPREREIANEPPTRRPGRARRTRDPGWRPFGSIVARPRVGARAIRRALLRQRGSA